MASLSISEMIVGTPGASALSITIVFAVFFRFISTASPISLLVKHPLPLSLFGTSCSNASVLPARRLSRAFEIKPN
jgi:hypothetical protein